MNALQLIEFFNYDYKYLAILLLVVEQREGRETVDRLLDEIPAPPVQKNAKHFVTRLRELVDEEAGQDQKSESRKLPGKKVWQAGPEGKLVPDPSSGHFGQESG